MSRICARAHKQIPIQFSSDQFSRFRSDTPNLRLQKEKNCCTCNMAPRSADSCYLLSLLSRHFMIQRWILGCKKRGYVEAYGLLEVSSKLIQPQNKEKKNRKSRIIFCIRSENLFSERTSALC
jgi:hypothetical protein